MCKDKVLPPLAYIVFQGPVHWTEKLALTGLDLTAKDRFFSPVQSSLVQSLISPVTVQVFSDFYKDRKKPV